MKKVLFISPSLPNKLNRVRTMNLLKALKGRASIHYVTLSSDSRDQAWSRDHSEYVDQVHLFRQPKWKSYLFCLVGIFLRKPLRLSYCYNWRLHKYLKDIDTHSYDCIYIKRLRMAQYARYFPADKLWIDLTDSMNLYYSRLLKSQVPLRERVIALHERRVLGRYENEIVSKYRTIFCSPIDAREAVSKASIRNAIRPLVIPNVVDMDDFRCLARRPKTPIRHLCYWGNLDVPMNYTAVMLLIEEVFAKLSKTSNQYRLRLIGRSPPKNLLNKESDTIEFTGYREDLRTTLKDADLFVCPMILGTGVKNKMLQSLALGIPILCTSVAAEGISGLHHLLGRGVVVEDNISMYAEIVINLDRFMKYDRDLMRKFVGDRYSIENLRQHLERAGIV